MATNYLMKIDGLEGEATQENFKGFMQIKSFSFGETNTGSAATGTGLGSGRVSMQDVHFSIDTGKCSPKLFLNCATGTHYKWAELHCCKPTGTDGKQQTFIKWKFYDLLISSFQHGGSDGMEIPTDQVSFNFTKVEYEYKPQNADGSLGEAIKTNFDIKLMKTT